MPLGGIGTGCLDIEVDGWLGFGTLFRRVWGWDDRDQVFAPPRTVVKIDSEDRGPLELPFLGMSIGGRTWVLGTRDVAHVDRARRIHYWGHFPVVDLEYEIDAAVSVGLRAWAPFVLGDIGASTIPSAAFEVHLRNTSPAEQEGTVVFTFRGPRQGAQPRIQCSRARHRVGGFDGVEVCAGDASYALGAIDEEGVRLGGGLGVDGSMWAAIGETLPQTVPLDASASAAVDFTLAPREERVVRFVMAWRTPGWTSDFPYGIELHRYANHYAREYGSAVAAACRLSRDHVSLLCRVLAWQQATYAEDDLPAWLRDQLVNVLHLIAEESYWAAAEPPLGNWCHQDGLFSLVEGTDAAGQQSCIPCDWYGNLPIVLFFPDLARSTLQAYRHNMRADGAVPFYLGQGLDLNGGSDGVPGWHFAHDRQRTLNGCCYADLVGRLWLRTGDDELLRAFYPSVRQNLTYVMTQSPGPEGVLGVIGDPGDEWYESMDMRGITSHAGGVRLAHLAVVERMARAVGDDGFAWQCREWYALGSQLLEDRLWQDGCYLLSLDVATGQTNDLVLAYQLDGDWIAHLHGLPPVFDKVRAAEALGTIGRLNVPVTRGGAVNVIQRNGCPTEFGGRMGGMCSMPASVFILAMNYIYAGQRDAGLEIAYQCADNLVNELGFTWDMPNMVRADPGHGEWIYGHDYYQCMSLWALPAALRGQSLGDFVAPGGFAERVLQAGARSGVECGARESQDKEDGLAAQEVR